MKSIQISVFLTIVMFAACHKNPEYCAGAPENDCTLLPDARDVPTTKCTDDSGCTADPAGNRVCELTSKVCVECTMDNSSACVGTTPFCDSNQCRGCVADSECLSDVCLPDGSCAVDTKVAYVDGGTGSLASECTQAAPCLLVSTGLNKKREIVRVKGVVNEPSTVATTTTTKQILGAPGAKIVSINVGGDPLFSVVSGSDTTFTNITIGGNGTLIPAACVDWPSNSNGKLTITKGKIERCKVGVNLASSGGTVTVTSSTVSGNTTAGISSSGGTVTVTSSTVSGNTTAGISSSGGTVTVTSSTVSGNKGGGVLISASNFMLVNNFVIDNGDSANTGSSFGGVSLDTNNGSTSKFENNTVAYNRTKNAASAAPGVECTISNFIATGNIVTSNSKGSTFPDQVKSSVGACTFGNSFIEAGSDVNALQFTSVPNNDFHLTASSPSSVKNKAGFTTCVATDVDGEMRPQEGLCDLGQTSTNPRITM
jgi:Right handed beta helix region